MRGDTTDQQPLDLQVRHPIRRLVGYGKFSSFGVVFSAEVWITLWTQTVEFAVVFVETPLPDIPCHIV